MCVCVCVCVYLYSQCERVEQNEQKHQVLKLRGVDDLPEFELRGVFGDVNLYGLSFQCIIHTLPLCAKKRDAVRQTTRATKKSID